MHSKFFVYQFIIGLLCSVSLYSQSLHLSVIGKNETETAIIDSLAYKNKFKDYASLQLEINALKQTYNTSGFLESKLLGINKKNDSTYLARFHLNKRHETIHIYYNNLVNKNILNLIANNITSEYFEIHINELEKTLQHINSEISNEGDPFSTLQLSNIRKKDSTTLSANLMISNQSQREVDRVIIKGYEKFPKSYLKRYLKIKPQKIFNLKEIKKQTASLDNLQFANQIKEPEVLFTKDSTILYIYVEKTKSNAFDGFLGFGTNEQTNKIEFDGYLNLNLTNNLNFGESIKLLYKSEENEQKTFDLQIKMPYVFGSPLDVELGLNIFKKDSSFVTVSQSAKLGYQIDSKNSVSIGINAITSTDLLDISSFLINDYNSNYYSISYSHINPQKYNLLFPVNFLFDITAGLGKRRIENIEEKQTKLNLNTFKIYNFNTKNSIYAKINSAFLISDNYLENELLRFGGINSIRGFEENSILADLYAVINTEYRYRLNNSLYVHTVIDAAYFENKSADIKSKLFGFGFGFGLITKAGLFKFNYSNGKTENKKFKLADSKIHLSLTARF